MTRSSIVSTYSSRNLSRSLIPAPFLDQIPKWAEIEVEVLALQPELALQLFHPLLEQHERLPQALDLVRRQRAPLDPMKRLTFHELTQEIDQGQHQPSQPLLKAL